MAGNAASWHAPAVRSRRQIFRHTLSDGIGTAPSPAGRMGALPASPARLPATVNAGTPGRQSHPSPRSSLAQPQQSSPGDRRLKGEAAVANGMPIQMGSLKDLAAAVADQKPPLVGHCPPVHDQRMIANGSEARRGISCRQRITTLSER